MSPTSRAKPILFICQVLILAFSIASCSREELSPSVTIGTGELSGNYRAVGAAIARAINQNQEMHRFKVYDKLSAGSVANIDEILSTNPYYSRSFIPIAQYPRADNRKDVETVGVKATMLTSASVPDEIVYTVTKAVFDELESLGEYEPVFKTFAKEDMVEGLTAPLHPGAVRCFSEIGLQVPPSLR